ncbi:glycosyltransferase family 4 protein [Nisaea acidiphila]|uniref:Glycosyltransferase family 4 protein n=1 Tax=Nisaea acidiphila TaxID=1862145 RepID=A0A9J7AZC4_9PROT|nr:glycosyltransferase family 4 protein [Nisaea acidiphila]UUX50797.1 glycosyltransferase family 4 protein [Nisaea acidiphila]
MQPLSAIIFFSVLFVAALIGTRLLISLLTRRSVIDVPNERSSHDVPKPRGGGIAVIAVMLTGWIGWLVLAGNIDGTAFAIAGLTLILAALSFIDDLRNLPARLRLIVQALCVAAGLWFTVPGNGLTDGLLPLWLELPVAGFAWLWFVNLFNFMDGIDGITGVETVSIGGGVFGLVMLGGVSAALEVPALAMVAAISGFLVWNWQPSRIFIGDVASIPLGFLIGWMLLETAGSMSGLTGWAAAVLLPAYYLFDATFTLAKRLIRRENVFEAHRQHFYQQATQRGFSHAGACLLIAVLNAFLILLTLFAATDYPIPAVIAGYAAVIGLCLMFRRGRIKAQVAA